MSPKEITDEQALWVQNSLLWRARSAITQTLFLLLWLWYPFNEVAKSFALVAAVGGPLIIDLTTAKQRFGRPMMATLSDHLCTLMLFGLVVFNFVKSENVDVHILIASFVSGFFVSNMVVAIRRHIEFENALEKDVEEQ